MKKLDLTPFRLILILILSINTFIFYLYSLNGKYDVGVSDDVVVTINTRTGEKSGYSRFAQKRVSPSKDVIYIREEKKGFNGRWE